MNTVQQRALLHLNTNALSPFLRPHPTADQCITTKPPSQEMQASWYYLQAMVRTVTNPVHDKAELAFSVLDQCHQAYI